MMHNVHALPSYMPIVEHLTQSDKHIFNIYIKMVMSDFTKHFSLKYFVISNTKYFQKSQRKYDFE